MRSVYASPRNHWLLSPQSSFGPPFVRELRKTEKEFGDCVDAKPLRIVRRVIIDIRPLAVTLFEVEAIVKGSGIEWNSEVGSSILRAGHLLTAKQSLKELLTVPGSDSCQLRFHAKQVCDSDREISHSACGCLTNKQVSRSCVDECVFHQLY